MSNLNNAAISGNLTRDPELRHTPTGTAVCKLGVAVNRARYDKATEERVEETSFIDVTVWSGFGELCARKLKKGDLVSISGRLEQSTWEDSETGAKRSKVEIIADQVDGAGMYRPKDEDNAVTPADASAAPGGELPAAGAQNAADDDIPF